MIPELSTSRGGGVGCERLDPAEKEDANRDLWTSLRCSLINALKGSFPVITINLPFQVNIKPTCSPVITLLPQAKRDSLGMPRVIFGTAVRCVCLCNILTNIHSSETQCCDNRIKFSISSTIETSKPQKIW